MMNTSTISSPVELLQPKLPPRQRITRVSIIQPGKARKVVNLCSEEPAPTVLRELIESAAFSDTANCIPLALGRQEGGDFLIPDLTALPHLLVAGTHEDEVDDAWRTLVLSLLLRRRNEKMAIELINCDADDDTLEEIVAVLQERAKESTDRLRYFSMAGVSGLDGFNARSTETQARPKATKSLPEQMNRHVIVLYNPGELIRIAPEKTMAALSRLCKATSRSRFAPRDAGIHLLIICDKPTKENLPNELLKLIPAHMVFRTPSSKRLLPEIPAGQKRLLDGEFRFRPHEEAECHTAVLPISTTEECEAVLQYRTGDKEQN